MFPLFSNGNRTEWSTIQGVISMSPITPELYDWTSYYQLRFRTALKSKYDHAYKIAYLKCTLNLNSNSKNEAFSSNRSRENEDQSWYLRALFWKY